MNHTLEYSPTEPISEEDNEFDSVEPGTPESVSSTIPTEYDTKDLIIRLCSDDEFGPQAWDPVFPVLYYNVYAKADDHHVADLDIRYNYGSKTMQIDMVGITETNDFGKGYGMQMYERVPSMILPDGRTPREAGFTFITETHSPEAERVWRALARRGLATNVGASQWGGNSYIWNSYDELDTSAKS